MRVHFPHNFHELWGGKYLPRTSLKQQQQLLIFPVVLSDMPLFIRTGHIIILRNAHKTLSADESRKQSLSFKIALACTTQVSADNEDEDDDDNELDECTASGRIIINGASCVVNVMKKKNEVCTELSLQTFSFIGDICFFQQHFTNVLLR